MITLYEFPISHFCEKVRWTLDYKNIEHKKVTLLPGLHVPKIKKMTGKTSVPVIKDGTKVINNSANIISYLDAKSSTNQLSLDDAQLQNEATQWEALADNKIGPFVRLVIYNQLLKHPQVVIPFFTQNGPWYGKFVMTQMYPKLEQKMRSFMHINDRNAAKQNDELKRLVDSLNKQYSQRPYLVGDQFSRADLSVSALLAPLVMPKKYGLSWPTPMPSAVVSLIDEYEGKLDWVKRLYDTHR